MIRKYVLPLLAAGLLIFAVFHVIGAQKPPPPADPPIQPTRTPFSQTVAGSGIVEPQTENISMGAPVPGVVVEVFVKVDQKVKKGDKLFQLYDRVQRAEVQVRQAGVESAEAQLARLEKQPRAEEVPVSEARVNEAKANYLDQQDQLQRARRLYGSRAIPEEDSVRREQAFKVAAAQLARSEAEHGLLKAGAWEADKIVARAALAQAKAQLQQAKAELERLTIRALIDGEVLQVNVRPGEYAGAPPTQPLIVLGKVSQLHVRVDIDEHDIPRFKPRTPALAMLRGQPHKGMPLKFVRVEPYVVPKRSLTGDNTERVDTRVLHVIYELQPGEQTVYVGQQLDVYINTEGDAAKGPEITSASP